MHKGHCTSSTDGQLDNPPQNCREYGGPYKPTNISSKHSNARDHLWSVRAYRLKYSRKESCRVSRSFCSAASFAVELRWH